jgi:hypothetical protein
MFFQILIHKDVGKSQIFNFFKEKKDLLIHEIKTSVNVKKKEIQRFLTNEVSKYIVQNKIQNKELSVYQQTYIPSYKVHKIESYIIKKEEMFRNTLKNTIPKQTISQDVNKSRNLLKRSSLVVSDLDRDTDKNDFLINKSEFEKKFEQTISFKTLRKKKTSHVFDEEDFIKLEDSLEVKEENKSINKYTSTENIPSKEQNPRGLEKMMKVYESNYFNRIHSSVNFRRGLTYDKDLIFIKPIDKPNALISSKNTKLLNKGTSPIEDGLNVKSSNSIKINTRNKTLSNYKITSKSEIKDAQRHVYPDLHTNEDKYRFLDIKYAGEHKETIRHKMKQISPEVQMKYFKLIRKKKLSMKGSLVF